MRRRRLLAALVVAGLVGIPTSARAGYDAPPSADAPQLTDPAGDSARGSGSDIVSALLTTTGDVERQVVLDQLVTTHVAWKRRRVHGHWKRVKVTTTTTTTQQREVTSYVPDTLVVSLTMAGTLDEGDGTVDTVSFTTPQCGTVSISYAPTLTGVPGHEHLGTCAGDDDVNDLDVAPTISGRTLTWVLPMDQLWMHTDVRPGTTLSQVRASTAHADPVLGTVDTVTDDTAVGVGSLTLGCGPC